MRPLRTGRGGAGTLAALFASAVLAAACSSDGAVHAADGDIPDGCHPYFLAGGKDGGRGVCALPYPSDFYRIPDPGTRTGARIALRGAAKPRLPNGTEADPHDVRAQDGFSVVPTLIATLPGELVADGLPDVLADAAESTRADAATLLVEADTGAFVAHYTDLVPGENEDGVRALALRSHAPLKPATRYVAALRGVRIAGGGRAERPEGFAALLAGQARPSADPAVAAYAERFAEDIVAPLERAGVARDDLQLAWDFTTGSAEEPMVDMLRVRELTLAWLAQNEPAITVTEDEPGRNGIWRYVHGTITVPLFLEAPGPGSRLSRDGAGAVQQNGTTEVPFLTQIPETVRDQFAPGRAVAYGHGFFGTRDELKGGSTGTIGRTLRSVLFGVDYWGMSRSDMGFFADTIASSPQNLVHFTDRAHQGFANWMVVTQAIKTSFTTVPAFQRPAEGPGVVTDPDDGTRTNAGQPLFDPSAVYLLGISGGHLMGGVLAALDPNLERIVLNVGGGGFTHMMPRAGPFGPLAALLGLSVKEKVVEQAFLAMLARPLESIDPAAYAPRVLRDTFPGSPAERRVLMQIGLGDNAVPNVASFLHARALGLAQISPGSYPVFGLTPISGATDGSALQLFDFGLDVGFYRDPVQPAPNPAHDTTRVQPAALAQMDAFLRPDGVLIDPCGGPCPQGK